MEKKEDFFGLAIDGHVWSFYLSYIKNCGKKNDIYNSVKALETKDLPYSLCGTTAQRAACRQRWWHFTMLGVNRPVGPPSSALHL